MFLAKAALELSKPAWRSFFNRRLNLGVVFCLNLRFKAHLKTKLNRCDGKSQIAAFYKLCGVNLAEFSDFLKLKRKASKIYRRLKCTVLTQTPKADE